MTGKKMDKAQAYAAFIQYVADSLGNDYEKAMNLLKRGEKGTMDRVTPKTASEVVALKDSGIINQTEARRYLGLRASQKAKNIRKRP